MGRCQKCVRCFVRYLGNPFWYTLRQTRFLTFFLGIAAFFSYRSVATVANVRRTVMTLVCICCWSQFLYCVWDPWLLRGIGNNTANNFIFGLFTYLSVAAYEIILFHWYIKVKLNLFTNFLGSKSIISP